jgi:anti-sigma factor RsiW
MTTVSGHLTEAQAQRLLDGQLDPASDSGVEAHVACCAECCALVDSFAALGEALSGLSAPELPADFTATVMARIDDVDRAAARERRWAFGLAAAVLLVAVASVTAAGATGLANVVSTVSEQLELAGRALRVGVGVLPGLLSALRLPLLLATTALSLPILYGLSRLMPAARTETF